jgi:hypothetical protein
MSQENIAHRLKFGEIPRKVALLVRWRIASPYTLEWGISNCVICRTNPVKWKSQNCRKIGSTLHACTEIRIESYGPSKVCARGVTPLRAIFKGQNINAKYNMDQGLPVYFDSMKNTERFKNKRKMVFVQDGATRHTQWVACRWSRERVWRSAAKGCGPETVQISTHLRAIDAF